MVPAPGTTELIEFLGRDNSYSDPLVVKETWLENVYRITEGDFADTGVLIDIGANIGAVSLWGAYLGAQVIAIEPEPDNLSFLRANLANHPDLADRVTVLPVAVTTESGPCIIQPEHGNSHLVEFSTDRTVEVEGITLEQVYLRAGLAYCDVLKIDIEGYEYPVLLSASREVLRKARYLAIEFDAADLGMFGQLVARLACDFHVEILGSPERGGYLYCRRYDT
jgi:FkbM family methyltransferase